MIYLSIGSQPKMAYSQQIHLTQKPEGIVWELVSEEELEEMPVLKEIWEITKAKGS